VSGKESKNWQGKGKCECPIKMEEHFPDKAWKNGIYIRIVKGSFYVYHVEKVI